MVDSMLSVSALIGSSRSSKRSRRSARRSSPPLGSTASVAMRTAAARVRISGSVGTNSTYPCWSMGYAEDMADRQTEERRSTRDEEAQARGDRRWGRQRDHNRERDAPDGPDDLQARSWGEI